MKIKPVWYDYFPWLASMKTQEDWKVFLCYNERDDIVWTFSILNKPEWDYLYNLFTLPEYRWKWYGKYIMNHIKLTYNNVSFIVAMSNIEAIIFYIKFWCKILHINKDKWNIYFYI